MKKIGILTFHRAYNYGALLQAYALQQAISSNGFECEIIDYRTPQLEEWFHRRTLKAKLIEAATFILYHGYYAARKNKEAKFISFSKAKLQLSPQYMNAENIMNKYDAVVVGSDQVWNLQMTRSDYTYFLPYKDGAAKLSYAASFGSNSIPKENREMAKKYLNQFQTLYVREGDGIAIINELIGKPAQIVVDPTLLIKKENWLKICKYNNYKNKYILLYLVADQTFAVNVAIRLAKKHGFDVLCVNPPRKPLENVIGVMDVGPEEFLGLISNAEFVVTTSYHGLILSMNLNTPFLVELNSKAQNTNSRIYEILNKYHLEQYRIESDSIEKFEHLHYDWDSVNEHIDENRAYSMAKLRESLSHAMEKKNE